MIGLMISAHNGYSFHDSIFLALALFSGTLVGAIITGQLYMHEIKLCDMKPLKGGLTTPPRGGDAVDFT